VRQIANLGSRAARATLLSGLGEHCTCVSKMPVWRFDKAEETARKRMNPSCIG